MSDWDQQWEEAHKDCNPKGCSLYGTSFCQTGCTLRWEWEDEEDPIEYEDCPGALNESQNIKPEAKQ